MQCRSDIFGYIRRCETTLNNGQRPSPTVSTAKTTCADEARREYAIDTEEPVNRPVTMSLIPGILSIRLRTTILNDGLR